MRVFDSPNPNMYCSWKKEMTRTHTRTQ